MHLKSACAIAALIVAASPVLADTVVPLTYDQFEASVAHIDLENCPDALAQENVFCRATLQHDEIHVFAFSDQGESPFIGFRSYSAEGLADLLK